MAGPPCAGKTTLLSRIRDGSLPALSEQLMVSDPLRWTYLDATELARLPHASIDRLFLHYDFLAQRFDGGYRYLPQIIGQSRQVVFLTLWARPDILRRRSRARLAAGMAAVARNPLHAPASLRRLSRIWKRHRIFRDSAGIIRQYEDWFDFSSGYRDAAHWVLESAATGTPVATRLAATDRQWLAAMKSD